MVVAYEVSIGGMPRSFLCTETIYDRELPASRFEPVIFVFRVGRSTSRPYCLYLLFYFEFISEQAFNNIATFESGIGLKLMIQL